MIATKYSSATGSFVWGLAFDVVTHKFFFVVAEQNHAPNYQVLSTSAVTPGAWYQVAGTYDGRNARLYVNGILQGSVAYGGPPSTADSTMPLRFGNQRVGEGSVTDPYWLHGSIDEASIYSRTLSANEIAALYAPPPQQWAAAGFMNSARGSHTATLLRDGRVLVVGGGGPSGNLASAEIYDPATGIWTFMPQAMPTTRAGHTATLLGNGWVLIAGGGTAAGPLSTAVVFNPDDGSWTPTANNMSMARADLTATLLDNGKVLVAGGYYASSSGSSSAETYNPDSNLWEPAGTMSVGRYDHAAARLGGGQVLVVGPTNKADIYVPGAVPLWSATTPMIASRWAPSAVTLANGTVLVTGGQGIASAETYDS